MCHKHIMFMLQITEVMYICCTCSHAYLVFLLFGIILVRFSILALQNDMTSQSEWIFFYRNVFMLPKKTGLKFAIFFLLFLFLVVMPVLNSVQVTGKE